MLAQAGARDRLKRRDHEPDYYVMNTLFSAARKIRGLWFAVVFLAAALPVSGERMAAVLPFSVVDSPERNRGVAADFSATVQNLLLADSGFVWIERGEIDAALEEIGLSAGGFTSAATAIRAGGWLGADFLVYAEIRTDGLPKPVLNLQVMQPLRAELLAQANVELASPAFSGRIVWILRDAENVAKAIREALATAGNRVAAQQGRRIVAPLYFKNTGAHSRVSFVEERLQAAIQAEAEKPDATIYALRFPAAREASEEAELALLGLTNPGRWAEVADLYVWGEFREIEAEADFNRNPLEVSISVWNGIGEPETIGFRSTVGEAAALAAEIAARIATEAGQRGADFSEDRRAAVSEDLLRRAEEVGTRIGRNPDFIRSAAGRHLYSYQLKLLETALFFDPANARARELRMEKAWARHNPFEPLALSRGHWKRVAETAESLRRESAAEAPPRLAAHRQHIQTIQDLAVALHGKSGLDPREEYLQARRAAEVFRDAVSRYFEIANEFPEAKQKTAEELFRFLYIDIWQNRFSQDAHLLYVLTEALWPHFDAFYREWRHSTYETQFETATAQILGAYARFGREGRAMEFLSAPDPVTPETDSPTEPANDPAAARARPVPVTRSPAAIPESDAEKPIQVAEVREIPFWPLLYFQRDREENSRNLRLQTQPVHRFGMLKFESGRLWISETSRIPLPAPDGWRNSGGNHYFWSYDPATREVENVSRKIGAHSAVTAVVSDRDGFWIGLEHDGLWRVSASGGDVKKWTGEEGLRSFQVLALARSGEELLVGGGGDGAGLLSRLPHGAETLLDVAIPATFERPKFGPVQPPPVSMGPVRTVAALDGWILAEGQISAFRDPAGEEWRMLGREIPMARGPEAPGFVPVDPMRAARPNAPAKLEAVAEEDGFWTIWGGAIAFFDPRGDGSGNFIAQAGNIRAWAHDGDFLWLAVEDEMEGQRRESGPGTRLLLFDKSRREWIGNFALPPLDGEVTAMAAGAGRLWIGAGRLYEMDASPLIERADGSPRVAGVAVEVFPLIRAAWRGDVTETERLLRAGEEVNRATADGWTALLAAVDAGSLEVVETLLQAGANPDAVYRKRFFPLLLAAEKTRTDIAEALLKHGADANFRGGLPTVLFREREEDVAVVRGPAKRELSEAAAEEAGRRSVPVAHGQIPAPLFSEERTALMEAAAKGDADFVDLLIRAGADLEALDIYGDTALLFALRHRHADAAAVLLAAGADAGAGNLSGESAYELARKAGIDLTVRRREIRTDPEIAAHPTPLMLAVRAKDFEAVKELLEAGENPNVILLEGTTALSDAVFSGQTEMALYLLENGFTPTAQYVDPRQNLDRATWEEQRRATPEHFWHPSLFDYEAWLARQKQIHSSFLGEGAFFQAADRGDLAVLERMIDLGMPVDIVTGGFTPLMRAARGGHAAAVSLLLKHGADPDVMEDGTTALHVAQTEEVRRLLSGSGARVMRPLPLAQQNLFVGVRPAETPAVSRSAAEAAMDRDLINAAAAGDVAEVKRLLRRGVLVDGRDEKGWTSLAHAAQGGNAEMVRILIEAGANVNSVTRHGTAILFFAAAGNHVEAVNLLLEAGADPNLFRNQSSTPMVAAIFSGPEMARLFLDHGGFVDLVSPMKHAQDQVPLATAARTGNLETVKLLLERGADPNGHRLLRSRSHGNSPASSPTGTTAFLEAARADSVEIMRLLLEHGANPDHIMYENCNALCTAAAGGAESAVLFLLERGFTSERAVEIAERHEHYEVVRLLKERMK